MTRSLLILLAATGSAALLAGAFAFQYIGGLAPCQLCLWQRWPHAAAVLIGILALLAPPYQRALAALAACAALTTAGIAAFHTGVERKWWDGLASCTASSMDGVSVADLLNPNITVAAPIRCDAVAWQMLGLSMASWNMLASLALVVVWIIAARRRA